MSFDYCLVSLFVSCDSREGVGGRVEMNETCCSRSRDWFMFGGLDLLPLSVDSNGFQKSPASDKFTRNNFLVEPRQEEFQTLALSRKLVCTARQLARVPVLLLVLLLVARGLSIARRASEPNFLFFYFCAVRLRSCTAVQLCRAVRLRSRAAVVHVHVLQLYCST